MTNEELKDAILAHFPDDQPVGSITFWFRKIAAEDLWPIIEAELNRREGAVYGHTLTLEEAHALSQRSS